MLSHKCFAVPSTTTFPDKQFTTKLSDERSIPIHSDKHTEKSTDDHPRSKFVEQIPSSAREAIPVPATHIDGMRHRQVNSEFTQHSDSCGPMQNVPQA